MRIAIVNDMVMAIEAMKRVIATVPQYQVVWIARDGAEAVELAMRTPPDIILMDLMMPRMDGVEATRQIMARHPCAILVVTCTVGGHARQVFDALAAGALDVVRTPDLAGPSAVDGAGALLGKIEAIGRLIGARKPCRSALDTTVAFKGAQPDQCKLIAIGASAGGPGALSKVLACLPRDLPAAVVVVQHVDAEFAPGLANWLASYTPLSVRIASHGDKPTPGLVLLAGMHNHLAFVGPGTLGYVYAPAESAYQPSVDVFFKSISQFWHGDVIGVLLTGMGRDGAAGLRLLRNAGHHTIVQDEATSVVFGMPAAAVELGAVAEILPLEQIGPRLVELVARGVHAYR